MQFLTYPVDVEVKVDCTEDSVKVERNAGPSPFTSGFSMAKS